MLKRKALARKERIVGHCPVHVQLSRHVQDADLHAADAVGSPCRTQLSAVVGNVASIRSGNDNVRILDREFGVVPKRIIAFAMLAIGGCHFDTLFKVEFNSQPPNYSETPNVSRKATTQPASKPANDPGDILWPWIPRGDK